MRVSQNGVAKTGTGEVGHVVGRYRRHGSVPPVRMMQRAHRIIRYVIILFSLETVQS